jgi:hypothetical protein
MLLVNALGKALAPAKQGERAATVPQREKYILPAFSRGGGSAQLVEGFQVVAEEPLHH